MKWRSNCLFILLYCGAAGSLQRGEHITTMRVLLSLLICIGIASGFIITTRRPSIVAKTLQQTPRHTSFSTTHLSISTDDTTNESPAVSKAPDLNGKIVLPIKIANSGLKGYTGNVAAVYAILDSSYKRG